ncbi:class II fumarate hydratase [Thalassolituus sp. LLYu03]|uniref:class II fumarate hydratase n=1 Tax=Thalassolituus sp. LLYu03 TaxID=3421656 RepID=UPI003D27EDD5
MTSFRTVRDSMGELQVPADALYAAQTQRAIDNFPVSGQPLPAAFIRALLNIKTAAARANGELGVIPADIAAAIADAAQTLLADESFMQHFPLDVFQTGSGTSSNMNANEVLATLASRSLGQEVSANDHVNAGQSSNDTIPSAIHTAAAVLIAQELLPALDHLQRAIAQQSEVVGHIVKTGRTHLMDAMPLRMEQALGGWRTQILQNIRALKAQQPLLQSLAQGGTAVGTGVNAHPQFSLLFLHELSGLIGLKMTRAENFFTHMSSQDVAVAVSGQLKTTAVSLMKIANDLRWMNSGPLAGLGEIELPALQPGSSIMPGKVNPVIPESVAMVAAQVMGNDTTITIAGQSGSFELNVMLPLVARNLCESIQLLANASRLLANKAISGFRVNEAQIEKALARNPVLVTALNPVIGYLQAADIAKTAYRDNRPVLDVALEKTDIPRAELERLLDPALLTGQS